MASRSATKADHATPLALFKTDETVRSGIAVANAAGQANFRKLLDEGFLHIINPASDAARSAGAVVAPLLPSPAAHSAALQYVVRVLQAATRLHADTAALVTSLVTMGLNDALARDLAMVASTRRDALSIALSAKTPHHPTLQALRWRVDVTISASALSKVLRPTVLLEMTLSDSCIKTFEVPLEGFHELRCTVARLCSEMGSVEGHPVLKIA